VYSEASVEIIKNAQVYDRTLEKRLTAAISEPVTVSLPSTLSEVSVLSLTLPTRPTYDSSDFRREWKTHVQPLHLTRVTVKLSGPIDQAFTTITTFATEKYTSFCRAAYATPSTSHGFRPRTTWM
jgi:hypothetical protein